MFYKKASLCLILLICALCGTLRAMHPAIAAVVFGVMTFTALTAYT